MKIYEPSVDITVSLPFLDGDGEQVTPTQLDYVVLDETGAEVKASTNIAVIPTTGQVSITVVETDNSLAVGVIRGYRQIVLSITTANDVIFQRTGYLLELSSSLVPQVNSFITFEEALMYSREIILDGWAAADDDHKRAALAQAYDRFGGFNWQFNFTDGTYQCKVLSELTSEEWALLESRHKHDYRMAQIVQADYHLDGSEIEKDIDDGLQSSTIGEVSQFYRPRPTLTLALSRHALQYVGKYIIWNPTLTRT